jgi:hypothetical protein
MLSVQFISLQFELVDESLVENIDKNFEFLPHLLLWLVISFFICLQ